MMIRLAFAIPFLFVAACSQSASPKPDRSCVTRAYEEIGGPISLIDQTGQPVTEADFKGEPSLVFFGFTYCPDVCPITLTTIGSALKQLPSTVAAPRTVLISVDPERDTPEALAQYISVDAFPDKIVGLTGPDEEIRKAADAFLADYSRIETPESAAPYTMDHTGLIYLMDENWQLKTFFDPSTSPEDMAACLAYQLG